MRRIRVVLLLAGIFSSLNLLHAQTETPDSDVAQPAQPDSIVQITAEAEGLSQVSPDSLPIYGGTYWVVLANGVIPPYPGLPDDLASSPIYEIGDGIYLVDGTQGQVAINTRILGGMTSAASSDAVATAVGNLGNSVADLIEQIQETQFMQETAQMFGLDVPTPGDGGDGGTNTYSFGASISIPDYGTNLWIAQVAVTNGNLTGIGTNTLTDVQYEIQSRTNLLQTDWQSEGFITGSETNNWTPLSVPQIGRTNLFIRLRSWQTDASSLPFWWQLQYFGTTGIDPYGNFTGDGWSNYEKFLRGWNPTNFYTPAAPGGLSVNYYPVNNQANVQWQSGAGAIVGYQVEKTYEGHGGNFDIIYSTNTFNVSSNDFSLDDDVSAETADDEFVYDEFNDFYKVRAQYANGQYSTWSAKKPLKISFLSASLVYGAGEQAYLAVSGAPADTTKIRLFYQDYDAILYYGMPPINFSNDIPYSSFTNGFYTLPDSLQPPAQDSYGPANFGYNVFVQAVNASNRVSGSCWIFTGNSWKRHFYDGRVQLKQNLIFKLRAAGVDKPFKFYYSDTDNYYDYVMEFYDPPTNHVVSSILHVTDALYDPEYFNPYDYYAWHSTLLDPQLPFFANYLYKNFAYDSANVTSEGLLNTGVGNQSSTDLSLSSTPAWKFLAPSGAWTNATGLLDASSTGWICSIPLYNQYGAIYSIFSQYYENEMTYSNGVYSLASGAVNLYGLPISTEKLAAGKSGGNVNVNISTGSSYNLGGYNSGPVLYAGTAQPTLQTVEYDIWSAVPVWNESLARWVEDWLPGSQNFSPTNQSQTLFVPVGTSVSLAGYAKMELQNGYSGVYAYLGQYFDYALKVDTNGVVTTNATGVLSPYGDFFATEAGRAALVTMPDVDTGSRGTNIVYCVSLQVDKNHDGVMDSSFNGADATSQANPMVCWVNNGYTVAGTGSKLDQDLAVPPNHPEYANYVGGKVTCQRDLENFFRLWIRGLPQLPSSQGYAVTFSMTASRGTPAVNLYLSGDPYGGTGYLTDTNVAADQARTYASPNIAYGVALAAINPNQSYTLPSNFFDYHYPYFSRFLFEGASNGLGQLTLTLSQNSNVLCQSSVWLDLHDIKDLYEQARVTNVAITYPAMVNSTNTSSFVLDRKLPVSPNETNQMIVYVHGWRMTQFDYYSFSESMFKRLYWAGYQGRFASLRWPTLAADNTGDISQYFTYNRSEHIAFDSAIGASAYFDSLKGRFPDYSINAVAHSMGNIVMMETLKNQLAAGHTAIDNYILMQAAVPAHCYDTSLANYNPFTTAEASHPTPDVYRGYPGSISDALNGQMINFFNTNDYALATGVIDILGANVQVNWEKNQVDNKPDSYWTYTSDGTNADCYYGNHRVITNSHELMPFVSRPRSKAVGALGGVNGVIGGGELNLTASLNFRGNVAEHSAQFNWSIQRVEPFYQALLNNLFAP